MLYDKRGKSETKRKPCRSFPEKENKGYADEPPVMTDVLGSYTGVPYDGGEPVQDTDDL